MLLISSLLSQHSIIECLMNIWHFKHVFLDLMRLLPTSYTIFIIHLLYIQLRDNRKSSFITFVINKQIILQRCNFPGHLSILQSYKNFYCYLFSRQWQNHTSSWFFIIFYRKCPLGSLKGGEKLHSGMNNYWPYVFVAHIQNSMSIFRAIYSTFICLLWFLMFSMFYDPYDKNHD